MSASRFPILAKTLRDQRRGLMWWALGLTAVIAMYVPVFSRYQDTDALTAQADVLPDGMREAFGIEQITTAAGYVQTTVFGTQGLLLMLIFAVGCGTRAVAGDEEAGNLDLYLAHAVSRRQVIVQRVAALAIACFALAGVVGAATWAFVAGLSLDIALTGIVAACLGLALLGTGAGALAVLLGSAVGRRGVVLGGTAGLVLLAYLTRAVAPQVDSIAGVEVVSPFHWYLSANPLSNGLDWFHGALLVALPLGLTLAAVALFDRRDIST